MAGADTGGTPYWPRHPRSTQLRPCAHSAGEKTESPTGWGYLGCTEGSFGKTRPRSLAPQPSVLSHPREGGQWLVRPFSPPLHYFCSVVHSKGPVRAQWFSPSASRVPPGAGSVVQPTGTHGQWLAPPSPSSHAEGADNDGPGAWRLGAVPGAACAPGPTPSCGGARFPLRQVRERLKGLGPRGPVRTAPPAGTLPPGAPCSVDSLRSRMQWGDLTLPDAHLTLL